MLPSLICIPLCSYVYPSIVTAYEDTSEPDTEVVEGDT